MARGRSRRRRILTVDEIVDAALALADREGIEDFSMRRLADELGVGTMTLYHYVRDRDHLEELVSDRVMAGVVIPGAVPSDWREALAEIARRTRTAFLRHPWIVDVFGGRRVVTPSMLRHVAQTFEVVLSIETDPERAWAIAGAVDDYAMGHAMREIVEKRWVGTAPDEMRVSPEARALLESGNLPEPIRLYAEHPETQPRPDTFEDGLRWLLDGFESEHVRPRRGRPRP